MVRSSDYKKVVFIDDDKEMVKIYDAILRRKELSSYLIHCKDGAEGIAYLKKLPKRELPDYILLDLYMPNMNGFEFLKAFNSLKQLKNSIEVFVCTSSRSKEDRDKVMKYDFVNAYLEKPLSSEFLELLIKDDINLTN